MQRENGDLRERLEGYQERIRELEAHIESFVSNQAEIEKGVLNALHQLDEVEDAVVEGVQEDRVITEEEEPVAPGEFLTQTKSAQHEIRKRLHRRRPNKKIISEEIGPDSPADEEQNAERKKTVHLKTARITPGRNSIFSDLP